VYRRSGRQARPSAHDSDADLGKGGDAWTSPAGITDGQVFRPVHRGDQIQGSALSEKVIWQLLQPYAEAAGVPGIAPHDCRRYAECRIMPNPNATEWPGGL
jgi:hypothetical protein